MHSAKIFWSQMHFCKKNDAKINVKPKFLAFAPCFLSFIFAFGCTSNSSDGRGKSKSQQIVGDVATIAVATSLGGAVGTAPLPSTWGNRYGVNLKATVTGLSLCLISHQNYQLEVEDLDDANHKKDVASIGENWRSVSVFQLLRGKHVIRILDIRSKIVLGTKEFYFNGEADIEFFIEVKCAQ